MPLALPDSVELGALAIATTLGATLFLSACIAPLIRLRLQADIAARLLRALRPAHHACAAGGSALGAILCAGNAPAAAALSFAAFLGHLFARQSLLPAIDAACDAAMADPGAARTYRRLHRTRQAMDVLLPVILLLAVLFAFDGT